MPSGNTRTRRGEVQAREELFFESFESHIKSEQENGGTPMDGSGGMPGMDAMGRPPMPMGGGGMPPMMPPFPGMNPMMNPMMAMAMAHMMGGPGMMMGGPGRGGIMPTGMGPPPGGRTGPGRGSRGNRGGRYFDFDAPSNQREALNYGDI